MTAKIPNMTDPRSPKMILGLLFIFALKIQRNLHSAQSADRIASSRIHAAPPVACVDLNRVGVKTGQYWSIENSLVSVGFFWSF
jgi:hypothetical protein